MLAHLLAEGVFVCHGFFAIAWWWLVPGGFPLGHVRFWANVIWPAAMLALCVVGFWYTARRRDAWCKACLLALAVAALAAAVTSIAIFPDIRRVVLVMAAGMAALEFALAWVFPRPWPRARYVIGGMIAGAILGGFLPLAQRAEPPSTHPLNKPCPWAELAGAGRSMDGRMENVGTSHRVSVIGAADMVIVRLGELRLELQPLLTFVSISQSGGWTILSRRASQRGPGVRLTRKNPRPEENAMLYAGPNDWLRVVDGDPIEITAFCRIPEPVFSHLNTFCTLRIHGHEELRLEFSPCGEALIEPVAADYPVGRPGRFAYCAADRTFRVVEASSGEKGPFTTKGAGRLEANERLSIGIVDRGKRVARVHIDDWAAQLSTALSPTAGWGVPVNAIEFERLGDQPDAAVMLWITLAGTSVGRGFDTVGHAAGIYRNRVTIESAEP